MSTKVGLCPKCHRPGEMFDSDEDWCPECKHRWPGGMGIQGEPVQRKNVIKIRIPVIVTKNGAANAGCFSRTSDGKCEGDHQFAYDCIDQKDYETGTAVVHVDAEIDLDEVFKHFEVTGTPTRTDKS